MTEDKDKKQDDKEKEDIEEMEEDELEDNSDDEDVEEEEDEEIEEDKDDKPKKKSIDSLFDDEVEEETKPKKKTKSKKKDKGGFSTKSILTFVIIIFLIAAGAFTGIKVYDSVKNSMGAEEPLIVEEPKKEVIVDEPVVEEPKADDGTATEENTRYVDSSDGLNLREDKAVDADVITIMPDGAKLTVLEEDGDWIRVDYEGEEGWCSKEFTTEVTP